jgi:primosomal protein N''
MKTHTHSLALVISLASYVFLHSNSALAQAEMDWQPVASETLITLPANIIEKRLEQDFSASPMAKRLADLEGQMEEVTDRLRTLSQDSANLAGQATEELEYEVVQQKSRYLDLLQESHQLRKTSLMKKQQVYQDVLAKLRLNNNINLGSVQLKIKGQQKAAQGRMEAIMAQVDQNLMHSGYQSTSPYADEYAANLSQIEQLKSKISLHKANAAATLDGEEVSSEEYLRQLLHSASVHQSLLDQEALMLSYMARLVALDAQALEYQLAYSKTDKSTNKPQVAKASRAVDLFL